MGVWSSYWAERAGHSERVADRLADELDRLIRIGYVPTKVRDDVDEALRDHRAAKALQARPLPAGPMAYL